MSQHRGGAAKGKSAEVVPLTKRKEIPEWAIQKYERASHLFSRAERAFQAGDYEQAADLATEAAAAAKDPDLRFYDGLAMRKLFWERLNRIVDKLLKGRR